LLDYFARRINTMTLNTLSISISAHNCSSMSLHKEKSFYYCISTVLFS